MRFMNTDTVYLLRECNSGCKCATNSMEQVMPFLKDKPHLRNLIEQYNDRHIKIGDECHALLIPSIAMKKILRRSSKRFHGFPQK